MKKIVLSIGVLSSMMALSQEKTGINTTTPKATLEIAKTTTNKTADVEGILIPRVSKEKAYLMANATTTPEESTMVYVNDSAYTFPTAATDVQKAKVADITENGYYFWNTTKWVKVSGKEGGIWKKLSDEKIYLDHAVTKDSVFYKKNGGYVLNPKEKISTTDWHSGFWPPNSPSGYITNTVAEKNKGYSSAYLSKSGYASNIKPRLSPNEDPNYADGAFNSTFLLVDKDATQFALGFRTNETGLKVPAENTNDYPTLYTNVNFASHHGKGKVGNLMGIYNSAVLGSPDSKADYVRGAYNQASSYSSKPLPMIEAAFNYLTPRGSGDITQANVVRNYTELNSLFKSKIGDLSLSRNYFRIRSGSIAPTSGVIRNLYGIYNYFEIPSNSAVNIENMYGLKITDVDKGTNKNYAIYTNKGKNSLGDILQIRNDNWVPNQETVFEFLNGTSLNGSRKQLATSQIVDQMNGAGDGGSNLIFRTQSPTPGTNPNLTASTEKMKIGADGKITVQDLKGTGERIVTADADGVLKTKDASSLVADNAEWKDGTNTSGDNLIYANQAKTAGNEVVITDAGNIGIGTTEVDANHRLTLAQTSAVGKRALIVKSTDYAHTDNALKSAISFVDKNGEGYASLGETSLVGKRFGVSTLNDYDLYLISGKKSLINSSGYSKSASFWASTSLQGDTRFLLRVNGYTDASETTPVEHSIKIDGDGRMGVGYGESQVLSEKLQVAGGVKIESLPTSTVATDKVVVADADGVLKTKNVSSLVGTAASKFTNDVTNTVVKLTNLSDGTTTRTDDKNIFISDDGNVGIGAISTETTLLVSSTDHASLGVNSTGTGKAAQIGFSGSGAAYSTGIHAGSGKFVIWDNIAEKYRLVLDNNGDFSISESAAIPVARFDIRQNQGSTKPILSVATLNNTNNNVSKGILLFTDNSNFGSSIDVVRGNASSYTGLSFSTSNNASSTEVMRIQPNGNVGIGTSTPIEKLEVAGNVKATTFIATAAGSSFPDYVFEKYYNGNSTLNANYNFKSLNEVETFVKEKGHLPGYTSAKEISKKGEFNMTKVQLTNVEKIEELYLHTIEQEKKIEAKDAKIKSLEERLERLEKLVKSKL